MINEPASSVNDRRPTPPVDESAPILTTEDSRLEIIRVAVMGVMGIVAERPPESLRGADAVGGGILLMMQEPKLLMRFDGTFLIDSEDAYDQLDAVLEPMGMTPVFRDSEQPAQPHHIYVIDGRSKPGKQQGYLWNVILLIATIVSVLYVGTLMRINEIGAENPFLALALLQNPWANLTRGIPYAASIMLILGAHELGHYFAARRRKMAVTLPFFLPFPFGVFGTLGAFISLRQPLKNRKALLEVGAAGPLAGLIFAIPILLIGLAQSKTGPIVPGGLIEGNSVIYALAKFVTFGDFLPNGRIDVYVNQLAWAGWTGLFVTGLNLIPLGQLDGGHVIYSLIGEWAKRLYLPMMAVLAALTLLTGGSLLFMLVLLVLFGRVHAIPLDNVSRLGRNHTRLAVGTLLVFLMVFVPFPLTQQAASGLPIFNGPSAMAGMAGLVIVGLQRLRR
jgi:Zn-dependent protease